MLATFQSHEIEENWHEIEPFIKRVLHKIDLCYTIENIREFLLKQEMQLWTSYSGTQLDSVCVTRVVIHPKKYTFLEIVLMAGKLCSVSELNIIEKWAKSTGCKMVRLEGRKGWAKSLKDYKIDAIILEKEL